MKLILEKKLPVTAVLTNDDAALGASDALTAAGLHVPEHVSVIGFGDNENVQVTVPPMTTVRIDRLEIGRQLAKMAINRIKSPGKKFPEEVLPTTLITSGAPPAPCFLSLLSKIALTPRNVTVSKCGVG